MHYHIGRMLIDENFKKSDLCPMCLIKLKVESRLAEQYLGEGVMEDDTRKEVNKLGFCLRHFDMLYKMQSKLGLALQTFTRLATIKKVLDEPKSPSAAKKQAQKIRELGKSCVVCKYLDEHMIRYYKTVAEIFGGEPTFKERIDQTNGFCLEHYSGLIEYSSYAGKSADEYLKLLYRKEKERLDKLGDKLTEFCSRFDYRNASKPIGDEKTALPESRAAIYGLDE